ncbi:MAG: amidohydrolase family protein [Gemmatimonadetes bacterium]|nr:amidohydrolase family protein [Gemmatimonadota bacterium]NIQ52926.1 amidohydrolase family protein [Gemmatimonadota bacterium]NIU73062.1 amidohydrolase family protein [Gammaproteobacteria bacterium]NIX43395.1 amidohydrolase family protein [Gemmatimonadota bacterium]NIY07571.1 amidohydrolase family protein [Gemmatimonadota bacterium]
MPRGLALLVLCLLVSPARHARAAAPVDDLALRDARVVDVENGAVLAGSTVLIRGDRIVAVAPDAAVAVPAGARVIDLDGAFVVPGLSDMHVHTGADAHPLYLAAGVTTVRVMMGTESLLEWRRSYRPEDGPAPRVFLAGPLLAGTEVPWPHERITTPDEGRASVRRQAEAGYDFVKAYEGLSAPVYRAIVEEATARGLPVVGHVPMDVGLAGVVAAGQHTIEHVEQLMYGTYGRDGVMTLPLARIPEVVAALEGRGVYVTPTLAGQERIHRRGTPWHEARFARDEMRWMDPSWADWWNGTRAGSPSWEALERRRRFLMFQEELTTALHEAGVPLLTGTDAPYPLLVPGFSLHHELEALVEAGLTPLEALRASTLNAAAALGRAGEAGVVAPGAWADLVVVAASPLEDLSVLATPDAVVSRGVYLDREELERLRAEALPR